jgi:hypothetical protein
LELAVKFMLDEAGIQVFERKAKVEKVGEGDQG